MLRILRNSQSSCGRKVHSGPRFPFSIGLVTTQLFQTWVLLVVWIAGENGEATRFTGVPTFFFPEKLLPGGFLPRPQRKRGGRNTKDRTRLTKLGSPPKTREYVTEFPDTLLSHPSSHKGTPHLYRSLLYSTHFMFWILHQCKLQQSDGLTGGRPQIFCLTNGMQQKNSFPLPTNQRARSPFSGPGASGL